VNSFVSPAAAHRIMISSSTRSETSSYSSFLLAPPLNAVPTPPNTDVVVIGLNESDQVVLGAAGTIAALVTLWSEYVLKTTGCGLPAGPAGLLGATEGVSYLSVVGVAAYSLYTKIKTKNGLPAGPGGILGAAEGLSYLAIGAGLVVLVFQLLDYGYVPNAVPMEGGMCT
jgi:hypothetical protein